MKKEYDDKDQIQPEPDKGNKKPSWLRKPKLEDILKKFEIAYNEDKDQREKAIEDMIFVDSEDGQWEEDATTKRSGRPKYTIDRITPALEQIEGNQQQTEIGIRVFPRAKVKEDISDVFNGLIRDIQNESDAETVFDDSYLEMLKGGYGGWRVNIKWRKGTFDQICCIKRIESAASSLFFGPSCEYTRKDANYAFYIREYTTDEFKEKYPDATETDFGQENFSRARNSGWFNRDKVRVAEFWEKIPYKRKLGLMSDGRVLDLEEEKNVLDELELQGITIAREREEEAYKIQMTICNGAEILEDPQPWPGEYIPLIPEYGRYSVVEGQRFVRGMVRKAKDAQRIFNYTESNTVETTALTPKDPYLATAPMIAKHQDDWENFTTRHVPVLLFDFDERNPGFIPTRGGAPQLQQALIQQSSAAADNIKTVLGVHDPSLGISPDYQMSGKAIGKEQEQGDRGSFRYQKNHLKSIEHTGEVLADLIQKVYDGERIERILSTDGKSEEILINQTVRDEQTGENVIVNDLSLGSYGVIAKTGPNTPTKKRETVEQLIKLSKIIPMVVDVAPDLVVYNLDINNSEEIYNRIRERMIQEGKAKPTEEETKKLGLDQPKQEDPMQSALIENVKAQTEQMQIAAQEMISKIENMAAKTQESIMKTQQMSVDSYNKIAKLVSEKIEKGQPVSEEDLSALEGQAALLEESTIDVLENQEIAGSMPMDLKPLAANMQGQLGPSGNQGQGQSLPVGEPEGPRGPQPGPQGPEMANVEPSSDGQNTPT